MAAKLAYTPPNLHDNGYAIGAVDFTGDTPIILGPDGLAGGFACPVVIPLGERWKMGQVRPGDAIRWRLVDQEQATQLRAKQGTQFSEQRHDPAIIQTVAPAGVTGLTMRTVGDGYLLLEYGPPELDITLRMRVHLLDQHLRAQNIRGLIDIVPGIRSLLLRRSQYAMPNPAVSLCRQREFVRGVLNMRLTAEDSG